MIVPVSEDSQGFVSVIENVETKEQFWFTKKFWFIFDIFKLYQLEKS